MSSVDPVTTIVIEAGGEPWERVRLVLERRLDELPVDALVEVHAGDAGIGPAIAAWCVVRPDAALVGPADGVLLIRKTATDSTPLEDR